MLPFASVSVRESICSGQSAFVRSGLLIHVRFDFAAAELLKCLQLGVQGQSCAEAALLSSLALHLTSNLVLEAVQALETPSDTI